MLATAITLATADFLRRHGQMPLSTYRLNENFFRLSIRADTEGHEDYSHYALAEDRVYASRYHFH
jgi:hypothetical protein